MKTPLLTLAALSFGALNGPISSVHAQSAAPVPVAPTTAEPATTLAPTTPPTIAPATDPAALPAPAAPGGYQMLVEAGTLVLPGENGSPSAAETLAPDENLRRQRAAVSRNAPALALARLALAQPIAVPPAQNYDDLQLKNFGKMRELARQFIQESAVRFADGDFIGALDSRLDCIEMGAAVSRGPIISMLVGVAIEGVGRNKIEPIAAKLDASQSRAAAMRLQKIEARRPNFAQVIRLEGAETLRLTLSLLPGDKARADLATPEGREKAKVSEKEVRQALATTPEQLRADNARLFNTAAGAARIAPRLAAMVPYPRDLNPLTAQSLDVLRRPQLRTTYERNVAQSRLLMAALELRAQKLDGSYPAAFAAPSDPFSDSQPLIYKRDGESYLLYSIGPDGKDNGGRAIQGQRAEFDAETGQTRTFKTRGIGPDAKGDILAPVL